MNMVMNNRAIGLDKEQVELRRVYEFSNKIFIFCEYLKGIAVLDVQHIQIMRKKKKKKKKLQWLLPSKRCRV